MDTINYQLCQSCEMFIGDHFGFDETNKEICCGGTCPALHAYKCEDCQTLDQLKRAQVTLMQDIINNKIETRLQYNKDLGEIKW
mgnify:FL=1